MQKLIPYGRQAISQEDIQAVTEVLLSDWLTQGPAIERFEQAVATYCGSKYAVAVNSATSALHIACLAAGLGTGDTLWTSPNTFVASANCGMYCDASVDFVDIDEKTYNICSVKLEDKLVLGTKVDKLPKVVIPVHFAGQSCEMESIYNLSRKYGFTVIEDASHAIGGAYRDGYVGCCQYSDMAVFSFHPVKIVTTGEGGVVVTNRKDLYEELLLLRSHGITRNPDRFQGIHQGPWYYEQIKLGFNYRMTDLQAALGYSQMTRIDEFVRRRNELANTYSKELSKLPVILPYQQPETQSSWHLYVIQLPDDSGQKREKAFERLRDRGVGVNVHYIPVHTQPFYQSKGFSWGDFPNAETYYKRAISLPLFYGLTDEDQQYIIESVVECVVQVSD